MLDSLIEAPPVVKLIFAPLTATCAIVLLVVVLAVSVMNREVEVGFTLFPGAERSH